jgi:pyruvate,orthophosphate dikinase
VDFVFGFDHRHARPPKEMKSLLGGKGANLAEMATVLDLPVPPGFTITTDACLAYRSDGWPDDLTEQIARHLAALETATAKSLGAADDPLLVSVRSGAARSMPGMMDTVLDLGLNDRSVEGLALQTGDARFAYDSYRRFIEMYAKVVLEVEHEGFEALQDGRPPHEVVDSYRLLVEDRTGAPFPQDPGEQLRGAIEAVFRSWDSPRARAYRKREHIDDDLGTAVNVQAMVFGNRDDRSGTGVVFTRDPTSGESAPYGDFLPNAQGEDVVAGTHLTEPFHALSELHPAVHAELVAILDRLEHHYRDMLDVEFTIEQGRLWLLQTRVGQRTGLAALRIAVAMTDEPAIALTHEEAVRRVAPDQVDQVLHPRFVEGEREVIARGLPASPGAAAGQVYFTAGDAVEAHARGEQVILVRAETSPEDVQGIEVAEGVLTSRGGLVSHAAVVARGWGIPAVCGAADLDIAEGSFRVDGITVTEGEVISIDGSTGDVALGSAEVAVVTSPPELDLVLSWADEIRGDAMQVRANADTATDAARARDHGAEGIGLARTEHMFLGDRLPMIRRMILANDRAAEESALAELLEVQRSDFVALFEAMDGLPVTVRLLDPPLHEFQPSLEEFAVDEAMGRLDSKGRALFSAARTWHDENPMLGTRGVRLGVVKAGLYQMQARAIAEALLVRRAAGGDPVVQIMVPLVVTQAELALARRWVEDELDEVLGPDRADTVAIGTMVETPRAALRGDDLAAEADFFSLGTNDLTQMTFGFSRDDVEGRLMSRYLEEGLLSRNPFETIDHRGVGELVRMAVERGRAVDPHLEVGVCGEHAGDPESVAFFYESGLDYVSCSPFRVPVARLEAGRAAAEEGGSDSR